MPTPMGPGAPGAPPDARNGGAVRVTIVDENKKPLKQQSLVRLTSQTTGRVLFQTTRGPEASFPEISPGQYLLEVGAAGYLGMHVEITVPDVAHDLTETVTLARDPAAVDLRLEDAAQLPPKARKEAQKGVQALELSNLVEAGKHLDAANRLYGSSSSINFLLGYLALLQKDQDHELSYLTTATKLDPHNVQAQNLLGQLYYRRGDYAHAAEAEEIVVASSGESLIARKVLANSYLQLKQFEKARENAQWMVDRGGNEAVSARLVLGQALAGLQQNEAAIQTLKAYLDEAPANSATPQVRQLVAQLEKEVSQGGTNNARVRTGIGDPELAAESDYVAGSGGMPPDVDAQKPAIVAGVQCPANLLDSTANPSQDLVSSLARFSAIEHMVHEKLSSGGTPTNRETRQYNYLAEISEPTPDMLIIQEYRDSGNLDMPDKISTTGLPVLAIAFHPHFRGDFEMHCEGLGDWNGQAAWLVHFRQLDDKPPRLRAYVVNGSYYPVPLKGRAWIRADNFQITHLETDLVRPIPEIHLMSEHTSVSYGPVEFKRSRTELWLPQSAEMYVHYAKLRFHRSERFDHFMLFATEATDTANLPKGGASQGPTADHRTAQPQ
jgi:Tetratricopeptide repeat